MHTRASGHNNINKYIYIYIVRTREKAIIGMALQAIKIINKNERRCEDVKTQKTCGQGQIVITQEVNGLM